MTLEENIIGIEHIGIPTMDIEHTIQFYEAIGFGLEYFTELPQEDGKLIRMAYLRLRNVEIGVYQGGPIAGKSGAIDHLALSVADIEEAFERVKEKKLPLLEPRIRTLNMFEHKVRYFTLVGPSGEQIEFSQRI
ncbi:VOC family protein [Harryflintia acetispora]|uniref:VOC family protein n=1 Tax=Harryflintia acetispora TaxID=1849041 RepID=UPI0018975F17|nr:VOC family protein [Harryflintia acetispora]